MKKIFYTSIGRLKYSESGYRLVVEVDQSIADYYRSLIPKWYTVSKPRWPTHITVVRQEKESPTKPEFWGKYDGCYLPFDYSPIVQCGKIYYWLNVVCVHLEKIREELGLPNTSAFTRPPEGFQKYFHMTIGNCK